MTDPDPEVERIAELAWRAYTQCTFVGAWPRGAVWENDWRRVARAVIADRAAQPPATDGPTLMEAICERDDARRELRRTVADCDRTVADARRERDAARTRAVTAERGHDAARSRVVGVECERDDLQRRLVAVEGIVRFFAGDEGTDPIVGKVQKLRDCYRESEQECGALQRRLDALATREPTKKDIAAWPERQPDLYGTRYFVWRYVRDALLTAQEPPANRVGGDRDAAIMSAASMGTSCGCKPYEPCAEHQELESAFDWQERAAELLRENDALRAQLHDQAREAGELITQGREAERAAVVAWLRRLPYDTYAFVAADQIVDGDHLAAKERP